MRMTTMRLNRDPEAESGGGTPAVETASDVTPAVEVPAAVEAPQELTMPNKMDDESAYWDKFNELSIDDRLKAEKGDFKIEGAPADEDTTPADDTTVTDDTTTEVVDKLVDKEDDVGWSPEEFEKLDDNTKKSVQALLDIAEEDSYFKTDEYKDHAKVIDTDPVIQNRLDQLENGTQFESVEAAVKSVDLDKLVTQKELQSLDFENDMQGSLQKMSNILYKAIEAGANKGYDQGILEGDNKISEASLKNDMIGQLNQLAADQKVKSDVAVTDPAHPFADFIEWAQSEDSGVTDNQIRKLGDKAQESLFAMYTMKTGGMKQLTSTIGKNVRDRFIKNIDKVTNQVKTLSKTDRTSFEAPTNEYGIDEKKYNANPTYREETYLKARSEGNLKLMQKLEILANTGKMPK